MRYLLTHSHFWHSLCPTFAQSSMGKEAFTHEDARDLICCCCGIRTTQKKRVTQNEQKLVQTYCKPNFDSTLREQPSGLCNSCRWYLYGCQRGENWEEVSKPDPRLKWDLYELEHGRFREAEHTPDSCQICVLAKWNPVADPDPQKRYMLQSREPVPEDKKHTSYKFCAHCYQHIGKGIPHPCTPANAKKNLAKIISEMSENDQSQVVAACTKNLASTSGVEPGTPMRLNQLKGGNRLTLTLGRTRSSKPKMISADFMVSLQKTLNCSENKLLKVARDFRKEGVQFEPHMREELQQLSHSLDAFFKVENLEFVGKNEEKEEVPVNIDLVYIEDTEAFITYVVGERNLNPEQVIVRVGLDGGQVRHYHRHFYLNFFVLIIIIFTRAASRQLRLFLRWTPLTRELQAASSLDPTNSLSLRWPRTLTRTTTMCGLLWRNFV